MLNIGITIDVTQTASDEEVARLLEPGMRNLLASMERRAKRLVPFLSGDLHDSIGTEVTREGANVVGQLYAGSDKVDYALFVERGTSRARAQPYLRPAMLQSTARDLRAGGGR